MKEVFEASINARVTREMKQIISAYAASQHLDESDIIRKMAREFLEVHAAEIATAISLSKPDQRKAE